MGSGSEFYWNRGHGVFQRCIPHVLELGRLRARGYRPLYNIQWRDKPMDARLLGHSSLYRLDDHIYVR